MNNLKEILEKKQTEIKEAPPKRKGGATYQWQDTAVTIGKKLGVNFVQNKNWFRIFRITNPSIIEAAYRYVVDANVSDKERLFYWACSQIKKDGRVIPAWEKTK